MVKCDVPLCISVPVGRTSGTDDGGLGEGEGLAVKEVPQGKGLYQLGVGINMLDGQTNLDGL